MLSPEESVPPLGLTEFTARLERLGPFEQRPFVAVAVSGGPDSLALALLAARWAHRRGGRICALCVDHRLRSESASEMRTVSAWLARRAIPYEILVWHGAKPTTGIQEAARAARYRLLGEWCHTNGCLHLLLGHQREDQVETFWLRRAARSGADGLAGMAAVRELDACRILRPLLDVPKARLVATLANEGQPFISDPSNRDRSFARARLREGAADADLDAELDNIRRLGAERLAREHRSDALLARAAAVHPAGFALLDPAMLLSAPAELAERALSALVLACGGGLYPPRRRSVARLRLTLAGAAPGGHLLGGCRFVAWRRRILVLRELAAAAPPVRIAGPATILWDRRFEVALTSAARSLVLGYLGREGVAELHRRAPCAARHRLPALIHPVLPGFWDKGGLVAVPSLGFRRDEGLPIPGIALRPVNSLSYASFAVV